MFCLLEDFLLGAIFLSLVFVSAVVFKLVTACVCAYKRCIKFNKKSEWKWMNEEKINARHIEMCAGNL